MNSFSFLSKPQVMAITWGFALLLSFALRYWGFQHPEPFLIRSSLITVLVFGPSIFFLLWILVAALRESDLSVSSDPKGQSKT